MNSTRMFFLLLASTVCSVLALVGGAYLVNSALGKQAQHLAALKAQAQSLSTQQVALQKAKKDVQKYAPLEKITKDIVPQDKDQAEAVRELVNIAQSSGVTLSNISFPASTLGAGIPGSTASGGAAASTAAPAPSAASNAKSALSQLQPVKGITGVYQLQITIQNDADNPVTYNQFYNFLTQLENNRRTAIVSSLVIQPNATNRNLLTFTLTLNEYIKP